MPVLIPDVRSRRSSGSGLTFTGASDTFTDADGTLVTAHTPTTGGTWAKNSVSNNTVAPTIDGNRLHAENAASSSFYYHSLVPPSPNYDVSCDVVMRSDTNASLGGAAGRMIAGANTYYSAVYSTASNAWQLTGTIAGAAAFTTLQTVQVLTVDQAYRVMLRMRGTTISMYVDGVLLQTIENASLTAAGSPAVRLVNAATSTTGVHLDNWLVGTA